MVTDPLSDMLIRLKNAAAARRLTLELPYSNLKFAVAKVLVASGFLQSAVKKSKKNKYFLNLELAALAGQPRLRAVKRLSKPSRRLYFGARELKAFRRGAGSLVLSTPKGVLTSNAARQAGVGGEALFEIW